MNKARKPDLKQTAELLAEKFEPKVATAVFALLQKQADDTTLGALVTALESGDVAAVLAVVQAASTGAAGAGIATNALEDAVWAGGASVAARALLGPQIASTEFHFDRMNPTLVKWLQGYSLDLIRQIDDATKESIRDVLVGQMNKGESPLTAARKLKDIVGLTRYQGQAVLNFRSELESIHEKGSAAYGLGQTTDKIHGLQVLKPDAAGLPKDGVLARRLRDFRHDATIAKAVASGKALTPAQIDKMVAAYARKYRAFRARTIARTESLRATNVGVQDAFRQAIAKGLLPEAQVRRKWIVADDERLCPVCRPVPEMNPGGVKFGQPFATPKGPVFLPPMHPNCRCTVFIRVNEPSDGDA